MDLKNIEEKIDRIKKQGGLGETHSLYYKGKKRQLPIYEVPIELLRFNILNGRIASDVREYEGVYNTKIESLSYEEANDKISDWIWNKSITDNEITKEDIKNKQQLIPGVITRDGIIVDGNRRFMLSRMLKKEGIGAGQFITVILDDTYEDGGDQELQIKLLEAEIQMGQDEKVKYNTIEKYLTVISNVENYIETKSPQMTYLELANNMRSEINKPTENARISKIKEWYSTGKLMLEYLKHIGCEDMTSRLKNTEDLFLKLNKIFSLYKKGKGVAGWDYDDDDITLFKQKGFDLIRWNYNCPKERKGEFETKLIRSMYFTNSDSNTIFSDRKIWKDFDEQTDALDEIEVKSVKEIMEDKKLSPKDAAEKRDQIWSINASSIFKKALGVAKHRIEGNKKENEPLDFISDSLYKLKNLIDEDKYSSTKEVEFKEKMIDILKKKNLNDLKYKIDSIRKISEKLKRELF